MPRPGRFALHGDRPRREFHCRAGAFHENSANPSVVGGYRLLAAALATTLLVAMHCAPAAAQTYAPFDAAQTQPTLQPPAAALQGVQPWDPYAGATAPPVYTPQDPFLQPQPGYGNPAAPFGYAPLAEPMRLLQNIGLDYTHLGSNGTEHLGLDELEVHGTFALPTGYQLAPLEVTPGFAVQFWEGPLFPDFPPRTYSAYLDFGWRPQVTEWLSAELAVRPGLYSDFRKTDSDAFRIKGKALGIFTPNPTFAVVAGILYLDRVDIKLLPAGGVIWTPTPDIRYELIFPQPKLATRLTTVGNTEWWWYFGGEYGGDSWSAATTSDDSRSTITICGPTWGWSSALRHVISVSGRIEAGFVFDRELLFRNGYSFKPDDTYMLRASIAGNGVALTASLPAALQPSRKQGRSASVLRARRPQADNSAPRPRAKCARRRAAVRNNLGVANEPMRAACWLGWRRQLACCAGQRACLRYGRRRRPASGAARSGVTRPIADADAVVDRWATKRAASEFVLANGVLVRSQRPLGEPLYRALAPEGQPSVGGYPAHGEPGFWQPDGSQTAPGDFDEFYVDGDYQAYVEIRSAFLPGDHGASTADMTWVDSIT